MEIYPIASSSSGNSYYIRTEKNRILVDVGVSGKKIIKMIESIGDKIEDVDCIFVTHEHIDHIKSIGTICKKAPRAKVYATKGTMQYIEDKVSEDRQVLLSAGDILTFNGLEVRAFALSHDALEPTSYKFIEGSRSLAIVTDTGIVTDEIFEVMIDTDLIVLEANHEVNILRMGRYPYSVQNRILSDYGHLSNELAGNCLCELIEKNRFVKPTVLLAHLSSENNTKEQAYLTVKNILEANDMYVGSELELVVLDKETIIDEAFNVAGSTNWNKKGYIV